MKAKTFLTTIIAPVFAFIFIAIQPISAGNDPLPVTDIKADEDLLFFPTYAYMDPKSNLVRIRIHAWVFEPERDSVKRKALIALLKKQWGIAEDDVSSQIFESRCMYFLADQKSRKSVSFKLGDYIYNTGMTDSNGHTERAQSLPLQLFDPMVAPLRGGKKDGAVWFDLFTTARSDANRRFVAHTRFIPSEGVSVVSDIDDTIKVSQVNDKKILFENTFIKPYIAVSGMADLYRAWSEKGAEFHYLSASPWQLYAPINEFLTAAGFPAGVFHMKLFGFPVNFLTLFEKPETVKTPYLATLMKDFPNRKFILVGDSGEKDPEIYAAIARENPGHVVRIFIRNVTDESRDSARMKEAFKGVPDEAWVLFKDPSELKGFSF